MTTVESILTLSGVNTNSTESKHSTEVRSTEELFTKLKNELLGNSLPEAHVFVDISVPIAMHELVLEVS